MTHQNFIKAITIISGFHSNGIIINKLTKNNYVPQEPTIHILDCVPGCINKLKENNFSLAMRRGLLEVDDTFL